MSFISFEKSLLINDSSDSESQRPSDQCLIFEEASINGVVVTWVVAMIDWISTRRGFDSLLMH